MDKFLDLLTQSVIVQGLLTLLVVGAWLYMLVAGLTVPDTLTNIVGIVIGFYFGGKVALAVSRSYTPKAPK
jgi:hypothetical protein